MLGIGAVGKSAFSIQFVQGKFVVDYDPTIEANYRRSILVDKESVTLEIFDTAGMEAFDTMIAATLRNGDAYIILYDITERQSFDCLKGLHDELLRTINKDTCPCIICGNKCDIVDKREVSAIEGKEFADSIKASFFETSAKDNINLAEAYTEAVHLVWKMDPNHKKPSEKKEEKKELKWYEKCLLI